MGLLTTSKVLLSKAHRGEASPIGAERDGVVVPFDMSRHRVVLMPRSTDIRFVARPLPGAGTALGCRAGRSPRATP